MIILKYYKIINKIFTCFYKKNDFPSCFSSWQMNANHLFVIGIVIISKIITNV